MLKERVVEELLPQVRSYLVQSNVVEYRRNKNHLLKTNKDSIETCPNVKEKQIENKLEGANKLITTPYGRIVKKPVRFSF